MSSGPIALLAMEVLRGSCSEDELLWVDYIAHIAGCMPSLLIIDDDQSLRDSLRRMLRKEGYTIFEAAEGGEGITVLQNHAVDVVLVDLFMPGKEGLETILELRRSYPTVKIIAMSGGGAKGQVDMLRTAKVMGRCQALVKPFSREDLIGAIESQLARTHHLS